MQLYSVFEEDTHKHLIMEGGDLFKLLLLRGGTLEEHWVCMEVRGPCHAASCAMTPHHCCSTHTSELCRERRIPYDHGPVACAGSLLCCLDSCRYAATSLLHMSASWGCYRASSQAAEAAVICLVTAFGYLRMH